ncbi:hypothetical protein QUB33_19355, partial [Microcoleus sp. B3-A4]|uniref:hypothetical protein n=1 Tax=Microcoleus sp. B3-A4 TaxID=2818653 RepID=UPI002FCED022
IATFNNRVRDGSEWFHYIISTRKALETFNPVSAFSLMRCISFARLNYLIKFSPGCQPLCQKFFLSARNRWNYRGLTPSLGVRPIDL